MEEQPVTDFYSHFPIQPIMSSTPAPDAEVKKPKRKRRVVEAPVPAPTEAELAHKEALSKALRDYGSVRNFVLRDEEVHKIIRDAIRRANVKLGLVEDPDSTNFLFRDLIGRHYC